MTKEIKQVVYTINTKQYLSSIGEKVIFPRFVGVSSIEEFQKLISINLCLTENGWEKIDSELVFEPLREIKGEKKVHFRKARRNSRDKTKGFREKLFITKLIAINAK